MITSNPAAFRRALLAWYGTYKRSLPWRKTRDPYSIWVSEIMLQQTLVSTVRPYYERFIRRFPDLKTLASSSEEEVLRHWSGLGYYSRARNLHKAAQKIVQERGGNFPDDFDSVLDLPGIGRYTAGAILSIAFGKPHPVLDGNVSRVLSRLFAVRQPIGKPSVQKKLWGLAEELLDRRRSGDFNQAMMELGATVCAPESPSCLICPVSLFCKAKVLGIQDELPKTEKKKETVPVQWDCLWVCRKNQVLLVRRPESERFLKGQWGLPDWVRVGGRKSERSQDDLEEAVWKRYGLKVKAGRLLKTAGHNITHHKIRLRAYEGRLVAERVSDASAKREFLWVPKEKAGDYLISSLWGKVIAK